MKTSGITPLWQASKKIEWFDENPVKFKPFTIRNRLGINKVSIDVCEDEGPYNYRTSIKNQTGFLIGKEDILYHVFDKYLYGKDMRVTYQFQDSGVRAGEVLRLTSIMEMFKNNFDKIKLYSTNIAVMFHAKYKFLPNIQKTGERRNSMYAILASEEPHMLKIKKEAKEILNALPQVKDADLDDPLNQELYTATNTVLHDFMEQILKNGRQITAKRQPFEHGFDMVLTKEQILENKDFFNPLYQKHDLDFQI